MTILVISASLLHSLSLGLVAYLCWSVLRRSQEESTHLTKLAEVAMEHLNSRDVEQKVRADAVKEESRVHIEQLTDAYYTEKERQSRIIAELEAKLGGGSQVELRDGRKIDSSMLEPVI